LYNVLITGSGGQVGRATLNCLKRYPEFYPIALNRSALDLNDLKELDDLLNKNKVHALINCAAYTAVDKAESEPIKCWNVNALGPRNLAIACHRQNIPLIHFSTDYVYHNGLNKPLKETDPCQPKNVYGASKLAGEHKARFHHPKTIILRTSWVYAKEGTNFVNTILALAKSKSEINVVNDQIGAPTWAEDLANAVQQILATVMSNPSNPRLYGVFNCSNQGSVSWFDFASYFVNRLGLSCIIRPVPSSDFIRPANRPAYSVLDLTKIQTIFELKLRDWNQAVDEYLNLTV